MATDNPVVSIIVPVYNAGKLISRCIDSIINQTFQDFELILIDDFSNDHSSSICEIYQQKDKRIQFLRNDKNRGVSFTRNKGISIASGAYITFIDSDDWITTNYLSTFLRNKIPPKSIALQGIEYKFWNNTSKVLFKYNDSIYKKNEFRSTIVENRLYHDGCPVSKIFEKNIIVENNIKFNESISINEDHLFVLEYYLHVENIILLSNIGYFYWFDYFQPSLTKKLHSFETLQKVSNQFFTLLPPLIEKHNITNEQYIKSIYTTCGINQLFKGIINSYINKEKLSCRARFKRIYDILDTVKANYTPDAFLYKYLKFSVINSNRTFNCFTFYIIALFIAKKRKIVKFFRTKCKKKL